jgi:hypothetical protein
MASVGAVSDWLLSSTLRHCRTKDGGQRLRSLEELNGRDSIAVGLIDRDVGEGSLERLDDGTTGRIDSRHDD